MFITVLTQLAKEERNIALRTYTPKDPSQPAYAFVYCKNNDEAKSLVAWFKEKHLDAECSYVESLKHFMVKIPCIDYFPNNYLTLNKKVNSTFLQETKQQLNKLRLIMAQPSQKLLEFIIQIMELDADYRALRVKDSMETTFFLINASASSQDTSYITAQIPALLGFQPTFNNILKILQTADESFQFLESKALLRLNTPENSHLIPEFHNLNQKAINDLMIMIMTYPNMVIKYNELSNQTYDIQLLANRKIHTASAEAVKQQYTVLVERCKAIEAKLQPMCTMVQLLPNDLMEYSNHFLQYHLKMLDDNDKAKVKQLEILFTTKSTEEKSKLAKLTIEVEKLKADFETLKHTKPEIENITTSSTLRN